MDTVTGATESTSAILDGVLDCVEQASSAEVTTAFRTKALEKKEAVDEEYTADVAVIGGGGSGLTTALSLGK